MPRAANEAEYIIELEDELEELREEVRSLREKKVKLSTSKKALQKELRLSEGEVLFADSVRDFTIHYLFPRFKFLHDGWMDIDPTNRHCFSSVVKRHFPMPDNMVFEDEWPRIMVRSIALKYSQIRCNVNNMIRDAFHGEYTINTQMQFYYYDIAYLRSYPFNIT